MPQDNNTDIIVRSVAEYRKVRELAREVKDGNTTAINFSARLLAASVREIATSLSKDGKPHIVLVPMPGRDGIANYTQELAKKVGKLLGLPVENALLSDVHKPLYELKRQRQRENKSFKMVQIKRIPHGMTPVLIDNVLDSGKTVRNAVEAMDNDKLCLAVIGDTGKFESTDLTYSWRINRSMVFHGGKVDLLMRDASPVKGDSFKADGVKYTVLDSDLRRGYLTTVDGKGKIKSWDLFAQDNTLVSLSIPRFRKAKKVSQQPVGKRYTYYIYDSAVTDEPYPKKGLLSAEPFEQVTPSPMRLVYNRPLSYSELRIYGIKPSQEIVDGLTGQYLRRSGGNTSTVTIQTNRHLGKGKLDVSIDSPNGLVREAMSWLNVLHNIEHKLWKPFPQSQVFSQSGKSVMEQENKQSASQSKAAGARKKPTREEIIAKMKGKSSNTLVLFRNGDFYNIYGEDAEKASKVLRIPVTIEESGSKAVASFPHHTLDTYLPKLIRNQYRVAICDDVLSEELKPKAKVVNLNEPAASPTKQQTTKDVEKFVGTVQGMFDSKHTKVAVFSPISSAVADNANICLDRCYLWDDGISFGGKDICDKDAKRTYFHAKDLRIESFPEIEEAVGKALMPALITDNGQNVYNLRAVESKNGKYYLTAHLEELGLHPKEISKDDFHAYKDGTVSNMDIFSKYYPTKIMRHLSKEEFCDMTLSDGSALTKVNVFKQDNKDRPNYGEYMVYAEKEGQRYFSSPLSHDQLDRWFDKTVSKGAFAEEALGEKLHLESAYSKYILDVPENVDNIKVRVFKDIKGNWNVQAHLEGYGDTASHVLGYDDKCSLFGKTATKEQLAAKYCNDEIRQLSLDRASKAIHSKTMTV